MAGEHEKAHNELAKQIKGLSGKKKAEDDEMEGLAEANEGEGAQDAAKAAAKMDSLTIASPIATRYRKLLGKLQGTIQGLRTQVATKMDAASPKAIADAAKTQAKLVAVVVALSKEHKNKASELFLMDAADLKKLAIKARDPKAVLDGKSADYVDGQYEAVAAGVQINVGLTLGDALLGNADAAIAEQAAIKDKNTTKKWMAPPLTANKPGAFPAADKK
jgi:hypothetical protein